MKWEDHQETKIAALVYRKVKQHIHKLLMKKWSDLRHVSENGEKFSENDVCFLMGFILMRNLVTTEREQCFGHLLKRSSSSTACIHMS